ncbi:MAG: aminotransferase class I/II-fold pyridoxal phosphate-dependent enzyme [Bacteroidales bacterium]|nr:aminotransferase class I/II-fold pyridoxal phosphate-dependent enzyme [Bacteroidales bacterium]
MSSKIWLSPPHMGGGEQKYIQEAFDTNWVAPLGSNVNGFEEDIQNFLQSGHVAVLSSGTAAIHLALILLGIKHDDEVICSSFTFSASANPIVYQGATPVFIDSEPDTWNMDPGLLEEAVKERTLKGNKPKAIILVHLYGMPAKTDEILAISRKYDIPVIEDAAEALGSKYKDQYLGTFGHFGILSFNGNKIITTSGGGALISDDDDVINSVKFLATQARDEAPHYQHSQIGYNYRMSNIIAGIGRGQMEVLEDRVKKRRVINTFYTKNLGEIEGITFLKEPSSDYFSNFWLTTIQVDPLKTEGVNHEDIRLALLKNDIDSRPVWKPMHLQPVFDHYPKYVNGTSENIFERGLCLPSGSSLTDDDLVRIISEIKSALNAK